MSTEAGSQGLQMSTNGVVSVIQPNYSVCMSVLVNEDWGGLGSSGSAIFSERYLLCLLRGDSINIRLCVM